MSEPTTPATPPSEAVRRRLSAQRTTRTAPEMELRRRLHAHGFRFRTEYAVPGLPRRRVDIAFTRVRLAVMVDGCFWHGCPEHCITPKSNTDFWRKKFATNQARDRDTDTRLAALGWTPLRIWEHEDPERAVAMVAREYRRLLP